MENRPEFQFPSSQKRNLATHHPPESQKVDRTNWPTGPWDNEPDRLEWRDETTGLHCLITRHRTLGNLCGYVAVPPGHAMHGVGYEHADLDVHGGVNYSSGCSGDICHTPPPDEPDNVWWFGFDCAKLHDLMPGLNGRMGRFHAELNGGEQTYRDLEYVKQQCRELAQQLRDRDDQGRGEVSFSHS